jgi:uncharacterized protein (TIGR03435 family)
VGLLAVTMSAQEPKPSFEVASVRPRSEARTSIFPENRPPRALTSGRFDATTTLRNLIYWAFQPAVPIEGSLPVLDYWFVIAAIAPGPVMLAHNGDVGPMNQMLQSLLIERFKLRVRWETRSFPVFALRRTTTERLGRNLTPIDVTCPASRQETVNAAPEGCMSRLGTDKGQTKGVVRNMSEFARILSTFAGRRVVDDTGLVGPFALSTVFNPQSEVRHGPPAEEHLPSLRDALQYDLGFRLEPDRRDFPVLIVEHAEQPTEN